MLVELLNEGCVMRDTKQYLCVLLLGVGLSGSLAATASTYVDPSEDEKYLPTEASSALFWSGKQKVAAFRNIAKLAPTRVIQAGDYVLELPEAKRDLNNVTLSAGDVTMTVDEYIERQEVGGLLVVKDGNIVYERYGMGNDEDSLWVSFSVAKSVVSMLYGAAIKDGYIANVDEGVTDYLPRLKNSSYDQASIRNILQMASGVQWNEDYADPESDVAKATYETLSLYEYLRDKPRDAEPGEKFNYNTAETNLAGTLLRSAIGNNLATYLSDKIWKPFGMQADANWQLTEPGGGEFGGCCINATLRDYARIGLFALNNGVLADGTAVLPEQWMAESIAPSKGSAGYGYFWWLFEDGTYQAEGIFGQGIYVNAEQNIVIALHSAREHADDSEGWGLQFALFNAIAQKLADAD